MSLIAIGLLIGLLPAAAVSRLLSNFLFGLQPYDPVAFGGAVMLFAVVGLAACYAPVRRASRIDAMQALQHE